MGQYLPGTHLVVRDGVHPLVVRDGVPDIQTVVRDGVPPGYTVVREGVHTGYLLVVRDGYYFLGTS